MIREMLNLTAAHFIGMGVSSCNLAYLFLLLCSLEAASIGFIIIIDRRRDKWSAVKASLTRIAVSACLCYLSPRNSNYLLNLQNRIKSRVPISSSFFFLAVDADSLQPQSF